MMVRAWLAWAVVQAARALDYRPPPAQQCEVGADGDCVRPVSLEPLAAAPAEDEDLLPSIQDQFVEGIRTARRLKGLDGHSAPQSMTKRHRAERKARAKMKRERGAAADEAGDEDECDLVDDKLCDQHRGQRAHEAEHAARAGPRIIDDGTPPHA